MKQNSSDTPTLVLNRTLTTKNLVIFGMMTMAPLAPFQVFGSVAHASYGMVPLVYLIGAFLMFFTALSYAKFSREFPYAGSIYTYVGRGVNPHVGFLAGWVILSDYLLAPALMCLFASTWLTGIFPNINVVALAIIFIVVTGLINIRGVKLNAGVNTALFWLQISSIVVFIGFLVKFVFIDGLGFGGFSMAPIFQAEHVNLNFIATATSMILLGFVGFDGISTLAEETKEPRTMVGKATVTALVAAAALFFVQSYLAALAHQNYMDLDPDMALFDIAKTVGGEWFYIVMIFINVIAVGLVVTLNIQSAVGRVLYSMGRDNVLFGSKFLGKLSKYQTPMNAILVSMVLSIVIILALELNTILMFINFGAVTAFASINLAVIIYFFFKKKDKQIFRSFIAPLIGFAVCAFVWSGFDKATVTVGLSWLLVGVILGFIKSKGYKEKPADLDGM